MKMNPRVAGMVIGLAMAVFSSQASAAEFHLGYPVTGEQTTTHYFTTFAGKVTCKTVHWSGTAASTTSELTMTPKFETCTAFGFINTPIDVNGCALLITATGVTHVECPAGKEIEITTPGCTTKIGPQTISGNTFANNAGKTDVVMTMNASGITYNECGKSFSNATYTGASTLTYIWFE
jgi:hypothetical protein